MVTRITDPPEKMIELLQTKRSAAQFFHGAIGVGRSTLSDLSPIWPIGLAKSQLPTAP
jgi:hypothetical protein